MTNPTYLAALETELLRVLTAPDFMGRTPKYTLLDGTVIDARTETDVIQHLTARYSPVKGREHRFPGISNGYVFTDAIEEAGFAFVPATNERGQRCRVLVIK